MNDATNESLILQISISLLYPFVLLFGFYIIWNGYATPGGGFQGGSILATLFVARYIVYPVEDFNSHRMHLIERVFLSLILILPALLLFSGLITQYPALRIPYLRLMDILIGVEVTFGLGVAVLRFAFFKGSGEIWHL
ncbi:MAG: Na(+)/H(+) antiporter subunit B [Kiritimatiellia bacterium]